MATKALNCVCRVWLFAAHLVHSFYYWDLIFHKAHGAK